LFFPFGLLKYLTLYKCACSQPGHHTVH